MMVIARLQEEQTAVRWAASPAVLAVCGKRQWGGETVRFALQMAQIQMDDMFLKATHSTVTACHCLTQIARQAGLVGLRAYNSKGLWYSLAAAVQHLVPMQMCKPASIRMLQPC